MVSTPVAVIDIGSNSIKALIAVRDPEGGTLPLKVQSLDARISAGISQANPRLNDEGMHRGLEAIGALLAWSTEYRPAQVVLVATSAVRDAENGVEFCDRVRVRTGHAVRILTGEQEANYIGRGLTADPSLRHLRDFQVFDLGGGSLECLAFHDRTIAKAVSLRLGCVRLTEKFVPDPSLPLTADETRAVADYTRTVLGTSDFPLPLPAGAEAVGTGGTLTTVRAILGARVMKSFDETGSVVTVTELRQLLDVLGELPLARRRQISGLPRARADIFPVALATLIAVAETGGFHSYHHSVYNLRYGLAAELLEHQAQ